MLYDWNPFSFSGSKYPRSEGDIDIENPLPSPRPQILQAPPNYATCFSFVKLVVKAVLFILGINSRSVVFCSVSFIYFLAHIAIVIGGIMSLEPSELVRKVKKMKVCHTWSILIMNGLLKHASMYQYSSVRKSLNNKHEKGNHVIYNPSLFCINFFREIFTIICFCFLPNPNDF